MGLHGARVHECAGRRAGAAGQACRRSGERQQRGPAGRGAAKPRRQPPTTLGGFEAGAAPGHIHAPYCSNQRMLHDLEEAGPRQRCWWPPPLNRGERVAAAEGSCSFTAARLSQRASCDPAGTE